MNREELKMAAVIAWAIVWSVIAVSLVSSASSWILAVGFGVLPPLVVVQMWHPLARTVPAFIGEARATAKLKDQAIKRIVDLDRKSLH